MSLKKLYNPSLSLLTDLYQLTMGYGYWKQGMHDRDAVFNLFFRKNPFKGGYAIAAGLEPAVELMEGLNFSSDDLDFLSKIPGNDGKPIFGDDYLRFLEDMTFSCDVDAIPEGTPVFPHEPLLRIKGPLIQCQILESALLDIMNFNTLVATKASRICDAAKGDIVLEFGLRRAQGVDGAVSAARASVVGGCDATSNVLAAKLYGIPVKGTHAHAWVMAFDSEIEAFEAYAGVMPNNCIFLVDTYDTVEGVKNAVKVGKKLRERGYEMVGIRLDSGDLAYLSKEARKILDQGGFPDAKIVASNDLDEYIIENLKVQDAKIGVWGVGTKMVTAFDQPALGGVYKLSAIADGDGWDYKVKLSEQAIKTSIPGLQQVRRFYEDGLMVADMIYDEPTGIHGDHIIDPMDPTRRKKIPAGATHEDLLVPVFRKGDRVYELPHLMDIRERSILQIGQLHPTTRRTLNPHEYPAGLEPTLYDIRMDLIKKARGIE